MPAGRCSPRAWRSLRAGGFTFPECPGTRASSARLLWARAFDPTVLRARVLGHRSGEERGAEVDPDLIVRVGARSHAVVGGALTGARLDLAGDIPADWRALIFHIMIDGALPVQLAELARLHDALAQRGSIARTAPAVEKRAILALRTIDALGEGASLRDIGLGIAGDEWPGEGEWVKSRARRLADSARALWAGGPRCIFAPASASAQASLKL